mgnify:CR=1 FL=1
MCVWGEGDRGGGGGGGFVGRLHLRGKACDANPIKDKNLSATKVEVLEAGEDLVCKWDTYLSEITIVNHEN